MIVYIVNSIKKYNKTPTNIFTPFPKKSASGKQKSKSWPRDSKSWPRDS